MQVDEGISELDRESYQIVSMICSEAVPTSRIDARIATLRRRTAELFPERPDVFERTYGRRFQRLRTRFRPSAGLFEKPAS